MSTRCSETGIRTLLPLLLRHSDVTHTQDVLRTSKQPRHWPLDLQTSKLVCNLPTHCLHGCIHPVMLFCLFTRQH
eukprot:2482803-Rhodomonas_salina.1